MNLGSLKNFAIGGAVTLATLGGVSAYNNNKSTIDNDIKEAVEYYQKAQKPNCDTTILKKTTPSKASANEILSLLAIGAGIGTLVIESKTEEKYQKYCKEHFKDMKYLPKEYIVEALIKNIPKEKIAQEVTWYNKKIDQLCQSNGIDPTHKNIKKMCDEYDLVEPDFNKLY